jgi:hypothetical protein
MVLPEIVLLIGSMDIEINGEVLELKTSMSFGTLILRTSVLLTLLLKSIYGVLFGAKPFNPGIINISFAI